MMPLNRKEWLTAGQLKIIRRWIENGACEYKPGHRAGPRNLLETDFPSARQCAGCHPKQYAEWSRSMHAYAQHSPVFEGFNLTLVERSEGTIGTFCSRCHSPLGTILGENASRRNAHRSQLSMEGVSCVVCHRRAKAQYKSSGLTTIEPGAASTSCMYGPFENSVSHQAGAHKSQASSYLLSSQFCGECHDVTSPQGVRLEEAFSEWTTSHAARQGVTCQHCHMGPEQGVPIARDQRPLGRAAKVPGIKPEQLPLRRLSDHTFAGPDYSLLPDTEFPHKLDWMYETDYRDTTKLTPHQQGTLIQLRRDNRRHLEIARQKRYEVLRNAARLRVSHPGSAMAGEKAPVRVHVQNLIAGHNLPTGFTAERQVWVSVQLFDPHGRLAFSSGDLDANGDLRDEHSHAVLAGRLPWDRHLMNLQNKFVVPTHKGTERSTALSINRHLSPLNVLRPATILSASQGRSAGLRLAKASLPPLGSREKNYSVVMPRQSGVYHLHVRLNFRHLPPALLDHVGTPHLKSALEVVMLQEYHGKIVIGH